MALAVSWKTTILYRTYIAGGRIFLRKLRKCRSYARLTKVFSIVPLSNMHKDAIEDFEKKFHQLNVLRIEEMDLRRYVESEQVRRYGRDEQDNVQISLDDQGVKIFVRQDLPKIDLPTPLAEKLKNLLDLSNEQEMLLLKVLTTSNPNQCREALERAGARPFALVIPPSVDESGKESDDSAAATRVRVNDLAAAVESLRLQDYEEPLQGLSRPHTPDSSSMSARSPLTLPQVRNSLFHHTHGAGSVGGLWQTPVASRSPSPTQRRLGRLSATLADAMLTNETTQITSQGAADLGLQDEIYHVNDFENNGALLDHTVTRFRESGSNTSGFLSPPTISSVRTAAPYYT